MSCDSVNLVSPPNSSSSEEAGQFPRFSELEYKIKAKIWKYAVQGHSPRVVFVTVDDYFLPNENPKMKSKKPQVICRTKGTCRTPALLHTCIQSRDVASKVYSLCFSAAFGSRPVYFDFSRDELFMKNLDVLHSFNEAERIGRLEGQIVLESQEKLRSLSIGDDILLGVLPPLLECYYKLKDVTLKHTKPGYYTQKDIRDREVSETLRIREAWQKKLGANITVRLPTVQFVEGSVLEGKISQAKAPGAMIQRNQAKCKKRKREELPTAEPPRERNKGQDFMNPIVID
ncbi:hypothetical protein B7494_g5483 [Chlorociboria aeruginascens]|nr:hypothetical protein B7494_g5483 [Chlorociboria aeruginascens]